MFTPLLMTMQGPVVEVTWSPAMVIPVCPVREIGPDGIRGLGGCPVVEVLCPPVPVVVIAPPVPPTPVVIAPPVPPGDGRGVPFEEQVEPAVSASSAPARTDLMGAM